MTMEDLRNFKQYIKKTIKIGKVFFNNIQNP